MGVEERIGIENQSIKAKVKKEFCRRIRKVMRTEFRGKNNQKSTSLFAIPEMEYIVGILVWTQKEINDIDMKTRKIPTLHKALQSRADNLHIFVKTCKGGRRLLQIDAMHNTTVLIIKHFLVKNRDKSVTKAIIHLELNNEKIYLI